MTFESLKKEILQADLQAMRLNEEARRLIAEQQFEEGVEQRVQAREFEYRMELEREKLEDLLEETQDMNQRLDIGKFLSQYDDRPFAAQLQQDIEVLDVRRRELMANHNFREAEQKNEEKRALEKYLRTLQAGMKRTRYKDGIVNYRKFGRSGIKILWILREVNHDGSIEDWDMRKIISEEIPSANGITPGWEKTFAPIVYASYGILNQKTWEEMPYYYHSPEIVDVLQEIAYMNVKHTAGGATSNHRELEEAYRWNHRDLFHKINVINPDVIIYGGTYSLFRDDIDRYVHNKNIKHIEAYHPSARVSKEKYVDEILEKVNL